MRYYANRIFLYGKLIHNGFIDTFKPFLFNLCKTHLDQIKSRLNQRFRLYTELPPDAELLIKDAYIFASREFIRTPANIFCHSCLNLMPFCLVKSMFEIPWTVVLTNLIRGRIILYQTAAFTAHPHRSVYGHFIQHIISSLVAQSHKVPVTLTH